MSEKNYPYKSKVVLTEKQATKEPIGSYYHPTEKTFRSGACPVGMTLQKGYHRKGYMKMNGTVINNTNVDPVCVKNKGLPGKLLKKEKDDFKEFGYLTSSNNNSRFKSLLEACKVLTYGTVMRKLNILKKRYSKKDDNKSIKLYNIYSSDILMLQKWRLKNPDLYKVKSELLLVGGQAEMNRLYRNKAVTSFLAEPDRTKKILNKISHVPHFFSTKVESYEELNEIINILDKLTTHKPPFMKFGFDVTREHLNTNDKHIKKMAMTDIETYKYYVFTNDQKFPKFENIYKYVENYLNLENLDVSNIEKTDQLFKNFNFSLAKRCGYNVNIKNWKLEKVVSMKNMFENCIECPKLNNWGHYLGKVTNMENMFYNANLKHNNMDLSSWGPSLSNVTTMKNMFCYCEEFEGKGLNKWGPYLGKVKDMSNMFNGCRYFKENLESWWPNLNNLENMDNMFGKDLANTFRFKRQNFSTLKLLHMSDNKKISAYLTIFQKLNSDEIPEGIDFDKIMSESVTNEKNKKNTLKNRVLKIFTRT